MYYGRQIIEILVKPLGIPKFVTGHWVLVGPVLEPKYQKNLETFFLEAFLVAKPGRVTVRLLPNRMIRERCIAPITLRCN